MKTTFYTPDVTESSSSSASLTPSPKYAVNPSPWSHSQVGVNPSIYQSLHIASYPYIFFIYLCILTFIYQSIFKFIYPSLYTSVFQSISIHPFMELLIQLSIYLSIHLSIELLNYPFIHQ